MLFEDNYVDSRARQEEANHHARGAATSNAAADFERLRFLRHHTELFHSGYPIEQARIIGLGIRKRNPGNYVRLEVETPMRRLTRLDRLTTLALLRSDFLFRELNMTSTAGKLWESTLASQ